jgi:tetratricopeptide (TPR) repeat protein
MVTRLVLSGEEPVSPVSPAKMEEIRKQTGLPLEKTFPEFPSFPGGTRLSSGSGYFGRTEPSEPRPHSPLRQATLALSRGSEYERKGNVQAALEEYTSAIEAAPSDARGYLYRGRLKITRESYEGAVADFDAALRLQPDLAVGYAQRAYANLKLQDFARALADFDHALALAPDDLHCRFNRGTLFWLLEDYPAALADIDRCVQLAPQDVALRSRRAIYREAAGDYRGALDDFDKVVKERPEEILALAHRAKCLMKAKDYGRALSALDSLIERYPENPMLKLWRVWCLTEQGELDRALAEAGDLQERHPGIAVLALCSQVMIYDKKGDRAASEAVLARAIKIEPMAELIGVTRAVGDAGKGSLDPAVVACDRLVRAHPQWLEAYLLRAGLYGQMRGYAKAITDLDRAIELRPDDFRAYHFRARLRAESGELEGALADLERWADARPKRRLTVFLRGRVRAKMHDYDRAIADFSEAIFRTNAPLPLAPGGGGAFVPGDVFPHLDLPVFMTFPLSHVYIERGEAYLAMGDLTRALDDAEHAARLDPAAERALALRARVHGARDQEVEPLRRALDDP